MMDSFEALKVISQHRGDAITVTVMTANAEWPRVSTNPDLDFPVDVAMGKGSSVGLGLALARPDKKVIVLDGDGSLLMNLGTLVTIANMAPPNLIHFVLQNTIYRTTGGQSVPGINKFNFVALAKGAGYANVHQFENLEDLKSNIEPVLNQAGPTLVCLKLPPIKERPPFPWIRAHQVLPRFRTALQRSAH